MKTKVSLLIGLLGIVVIFFSGCTHQNSSVSNLKLGEEITKIGNAVPKGWNYTIITQNLEGLSRPHGLWSPVAIVNFTNPSLDFEVPGGYSQHPSLSLYFYNISEKQEITGTIANESVFSWCIPIYFNETHSYIIVTSPCYINGGVFTDAAQGYYTVLEKSLKDYFYEFTKTSSDA